jgi:hypothetical protein
MSFGAVVVPSQYRRFVKYSHAWSPDMLHGPNHARDDRGVFS